MLKRLLQLNGISILAVLLFHSSGWGFVALFFWAHRYLPAGAAAYDPTGSLAYYGLRTIEQVVVFAIPAFLFVSGLFVAIAAGRRQKVSWNLVGTRLRDLLIPYLLWSALLLGLAFVQGARYGWLDYLVILLTGRANPAYYYVILLAQFYLLSPLLVWLARRYWGWLLAGAALIQLAVQLLYYPTLLNAPAPALLEPFVDITPHWFFATRLFWFSAGIVAGFHIRTFQSLAERVRWPALVATLLLIPLAMIEWEWIFQGRGHVWLGHRETLLDTVYSATFILAFLGFHQAKLPFSRQTADLGVKSFGIYLIHSPVMEYTARAVYHFAPALLASQLLLQPLLIILGLALPLAAMALVNYSPARAYYKLAFG